MSRSSRSPLLVPVAAIAVLAMLGASVTDQVRADRDARTLAQERAEAVDAAAAAHDAEIARQTRVSRAATARLTLQGDAWQRHRFDAATREAVEALHTAETVSATVAEVVEQDALAPLRDAVTTLDLLVSRTAGTGETSIDATDALLAAVETVARLSAEVRATADQRLAEAALAAATTEAIVAELVARTAAAADAANGQIPAWALCGVAFDPTVRLRCDAAVALERLNTAHRARFGTNLVVTSSYRDLDTQVATKAERGELAAEPGTSNHGRGLAIDLAHTGTVGQFDTPRYLWLKEHAAEYGWHHPAAMEPGGTGAQEPWHWEFGIS